jgi:predicted hydrocarbon binding protein
MGLSAFVKKLLFARGLDIDKNLRILGVKKVMVSPELICKLQDKGQEEIYKLAKELMIAEVRQLRKSLRMESEKLLELSLNLLDTYGLGSFEVTKLEEKEAWVDVGRTPFKASGKRKTCFFTAGLLAGAFQEYFEKEVSCEEVSCKNEGGEWCRFVLKAKA